jgi:YidC/Oxa1 family membrane protein insertase
MHDDTRNMTTAVILSMVFLLVYYGYVAPMLAPAKNDQATQSVSQIPSQNVGLDPLANAATPVRPLQDVLSEGNRFPIETAGLKGSLSLSGLLLDDMILKNFFTELDGKEPVRLLTPPQTDKPDTFLRIGWLGEGAQPVSTKSLSGRSISASPSRAAAMGNNARGGIRPSRASTAFASPAARRSAKMPKADL